VSVKITLDSENTDLHKWLVVGREALTLQRSASAIPADLEVHMASAADRACRGA